jgi:hypothetical protein
MKKSLDDIIEDIQEAQVEAGGRFLKRSVIKEMKVLDLINLLLPNNVEFNIKYNAKI